jgi:hypothetical protein
VSTNAGIARGSVAQPTMRFANASRTLRRTGRLTVELVASRNAPGLRDQA